MNIRIYYFIYAILTAVLIATISLFNYNAINNSEEKSIPVVLAYNKEQTGKSSAVYIGDGYFLTATHILSEDQKALVMETDSGQRFVADLIWSSTSYDISLLYSKNYEQVNITHYKISCDGVELGQELQFIGNPTNLNFVHTWGKVAADPLQIPDMWRRVIPVNATILPGMSGGAVLDSNGKLRGINVGTLTAVSGMSPLGPQVSFSGISYIVESSDICFLMGKT
jgi:serine protease Do